MWQQRSERFWRSVSSCSLPCLATVAEFTARVLVSPSLRLSRTEPSWRPLTFRLRPGKDFVEKHSLGRCIMSYSCSWLRCGARAWKIGACARHCSWWWWDSNDLQARDSLGWGRCWKPKQMGALQSYDRPPHPRSPTMNTHTMLVRGELLTRHLQ